MSESRPYTREEVREIFLSEAIAIARDWGSLEYKTKKQVAEGVVFSMLALLDGASFFPACILIPAPHPDDKKFSIAGGDNYFTPVHKDFELGLMDFGGYLHEDFFKVLRGN